MPEGPPSPPSPARTEARARLEAGLLVVAALAAVASVVTRAAMGVFNHDVGWTLEAAGRLLDGGSIPRHVFDNNPPLIYWLSVPVVGLARALGVPPLVAWDAVTLALCAGVAFALYRLLTGAGTWRRAPAMAATGAALTALLVLPQASFGQRDHLVAALLVPYVTAVGLTATGRSPAPRARAALAFAAAVAIALKPFYALVWLLAEAWLAASPAGPRHGLRGALARRDNQIIAAAGALYVAAVLVFTPGWLEAAQVAASLYGAYAEGVPWPNAAAAALALAGTLALVVRQPPAVAPLARALLLAALAGYAVVHVQGMGFSYHFIPAGVLTALLLAILLLGIDGPTWDALLRVPASMRPALLLVVAAALGAVSAAGYAARPAQATAAARLAQLFRAEAPGEAVFVMSSSVPPAYPAINLAGVRSASRFSCLWPAPGLYADAPADARPFPYRPLADRGPTERAFVDAVVADLTRDRPRLILNHRAPHKQGFGATRFDYLDYFLTDPRFEALFRAYEPRPAVGTFDVYRRR